MALTENQQKWLDALKSGDYLKGVGTLQQHYEDITGEKTEDRYCCLGVACKVAEKEGVKVEKNISRNNEIFGHTLKQQPAVQEWLGLKHSSGAIGYSYRHGNMPIEGLTHLNDEVGYDSFEPVIKMIEECQEDLFE